MISIRWILLKRAAGFFAIAFIFSVSGCTGGGRENKIVIGSKNFTEQVVLGELLAQEIEANTKLTVERRLNLGGTFLCHQALISGQIDAYVEYTGTALTAILKRPPVVDPKPAYDAVKTGYADNFGLRWLPPLGFNNTFAMVVRDDAETKNLATLSQAAPFAPKWRVGVGYEFLEREDGLPGLKKAYALSFQEKPVVLDLGLMYRALSEKKVDLVAGNSTDGLIKKLGLKILRDDRNYFPPYQAAIVAREAPLKNHPEVEAVFTRLSGTVSENDMQELNLAVDSGGKDVKSAVTEFRAAKGL